MPGQKALVISINRKLAPQGKAVVKAPRDDVGHEYFLIDSSLGTKRHLSLDDVKRKRMALELGMGPSLTPS